VIVNRLSAADHPSGAGSARVMTFHKKIPGVLESRANRRRLIHRWHHDGAINPQSRCASSLPPQMTECIGHAIGVMGRNSQKVRFFHRQKIFLNLLETKVHPAIKEMVPVMERVSEGHMTFEAGDKLSGIALDSRLTIEAQPEFGMVVFATPG